MSVAGVEGAEPSRSAAGAAGATASGTVANTSPATAVAAATSAAGAGGREARPGFDAPELVSGLLSENITPWQRESLGRLGNLFRMTPKDLLAALRSGGGLGFLLSARRFAPAVLVGRFDKGLLIDLQA